MDPLSTHLESLIFVGAPAISFDQIKSALEESLAVTISDDELSALIDDLQLKYTNEAFSMEIVAMSGGFRFMTKGAYHNTVGTYLRQNTHKKLSKSALETLAIIAYKQPIPKSELEAIRGVNCDYTIHKLLEKELVEIVGRSQGPGKPLLYGTASKFIDYFGLNTIDDLPKPKEIEPADQEIGNLVTEQP